MMGLFTINLSARRVLAGGGSRPAGWRSEPDVVVLEPAPGTTPSAKPPVRIFVGTESGQHRSERVFVWSVNQHRDATRRYEIYLMRDLVGFDRKRWLTGFTNYRFAIPQLAGSSGRAIYNDVDQMYLDDPAGLFDLDMGAHGFLSLNDRDTAVMLMDCARMAPVWTLADAHVEQRKRIEGKARSIPDMWGPLPRQWHARDEEFEPGFSKLLHFTTIHTQPWQPFPDQFVYQSNPVGNGWCELERQALRAGFQVFTREHPSQPYRMLRASRPQRVDRASFRDDEARLREAVREVGASSLLMCGLHVGAPHSFSDVARVDALDLTAMDDLAGGSWDAVACCDGLECITDEDMPWVVDTLFAQAARLVYLEVRDGEGQIALADGGTHRVPARGEGWWTDLIENASRRFPTLRWQLVLHPETSPAGRVRIRHGGPRPDGQVPKVWVLADDKLGHTTQSVGLADALGWPYEIKQLHFNRLNKLSDRLLGASLLGVDKTARATLVPPWPDLVIATGRRAAPVARWIGAQSEGRTRLVHLGRKGADRADDFDLTVACAHFGLPLHSRRVATLAPLNAIDDRRLHEAALAWANLFVGSRPHIALLVGGSSSLHELDAATATCMVREVVEAAKASGGTLYVVTSPRTGKAATAALRAGLGDGGSLYDWKRGDPKNPYLGCLAVADILVVTGDSESMLAEAAATGKALYIYPIPERRGSLRKRLRQRLRAWVGTRAQARPRTPKGTVRPQQGIEYVCARLIERGWVRPPRDLAGMHSQLFQAGIASPFSSTLSSAPHAPLRELDHVVDRVRALLGQPPPTVES